VRIERARESHALHSSPSPLMTQSVACAAR
jgi:hypothetical protein